MADLPSVIGYFIVTGNVIEAIADSTDPESQPDAVPADAIVTFTPDGIPSDRPYLIVSGTGQLVIPKPITAQLIDGVLYAPDNGSEPATNESPTSPGVSLVSPLQASIDLNGWRWLAKITPPTVGAGWAEFTIPVVGSPGDTITLADAAFTQATRQVTQQPGVWPVAGTTIPAEAKTGDYLLNTSVTPNALYLIGA